MTRFPVRLGYRSKWGDVRSNSECGRSGQGSGQGVEGGCRISRACRPARFHVLTFSPSRLSSFTERLRSFSSYAMLLGFVYRRFFQGTKLPSVAWVFAFRWAGKVALKQQYRGRIYDDKVASDCVCWSVGIRARVCGRSATGDYRGSGSGDRRQGSDST